MTDVKTMWSYYHMAKNLFQNIYMGQARKRFMSYAV
jgi:hypothetical protein